MGNEFQYQMLDRMRSDCEYFLGYGNRCTKDLWGKRELWNDYHIIMNNGVVAVKVNGTIISLCAEDDGSIAVDDEHDLRFSVYWVDELIKALELAKKKIQDLKKEN